MRVGIDCRKIGDFGIGSYIRGLISGLAASSGEFELVLLGPDSLRDLAATDGRFRFEPAEAPHYSIREMFVVGRAAARAAVDVFHAPHYVTPAGNIPLVTTIHDLIHLEIPHRNPFKPLYARTMLGRAVRNSRRLITVSQAVRDQIADQWPYSDGKIEVIPNGVADPFFDPRQPDDETTIARLGLRADGYFLWVGNDKPHKNLDGLFEAWRRIRGQLPHAALAIVGSKPDRAPAEERVRELGFVDEPTLARLQRCAIALVQPSFHEGFGLPVAEAMASGTPVIVADIPALREVAGEAARLVDPRRPESIAAAMLAVARDAALRDTMIRAGCDRAASLRWRMAADATLSVYRSASSR